MKLLYFLLFITLAHSALSQNHSVTPYPFWPANGYVVSIRQHNSGIPTCSGVFISKNTVLTTARCLVCDDECKIKVFVYNGDKKQEFAVDSIATPPELSRRNPFGLIKIKGEAPEDFVVKIHNKDFDTSAVPKYAFRGKLHDGKFYFEAKRVDLLDHAKCTFTLGKYIPQHDFCAFAHDKFIFSGQDEGSPFLYDHNGKMHLLGIYVPQNPYLDREARIVVYSGIWPKAKWINGYTKIDDGCSEPVYTFPGLLPPQNILPPFEPVSPPHNSIPSSFDNFNSYNPLPPPTEPVSPPQELPVPPFHLQNNDPAPINPDPSPKRVLPTIKPGHPVHFFKY